MDHPSKTRPVWRWGTGRLRRRETVQDRWRRVGSWDLPAAHTVTTATDAWLSVRRFTLSEHQLLRGKTRQVATSIHSISRSANDAHDDGGRARVRGHGISRLRAGVSGQP